MEGSILGDDLPLPPARLYERLAQVPHYTWDTSFPPFHSTYDHWHVMGILHNSEIETPATTTSNLTSISARSNSARASPILDHRPSIRHHHWSSLSGTSEGSDISSSKQENELPWTPVVARISTHILRLEREYNYNKKIIGLCDPECRHTARPVDIFRLPTTPGDANSMMVCVYENPGKNALRELLDFGPAFYGMSNNKMTVAASAEVRLGVQAFLDFAIGACECLELLHHGAKAIHGEIRPDSFHWNTETGVVKLLNAGNGPRSFENLLSSEGWATLNRELGIKTKLQFIAPEQTGRLPAEPDSRTDLYSLGILFWTLLSGEPAFDGDNPIDVVQKVLTTRLPMVTATRIDVPDVISNIIAKMTQKQMDSRYHSVSGLRHDLAQISKFLGEGDQDKIEKYKIGQRDVSAFFNLPSKQFGRHTENEKICKIIEKVHKRQVSAASRLATTPHQLLSATSNSSISGAEVLDVADGSDSSSSFGLRETRSNSTTLGLDGQGFVPLYNNKPIFGRGIVEQRNSSIDMSDKDSNLSGGFGPQADGIGMMGRRRNSHKFSRRGKTEIITVLGPQGVGKSTLIKSVQPHIRRHGYFAMARFDKARPTPFEPMIKVIGSLFRQIFSEKDVNTTYHEHLRAHVRPLWNVLHNVLDLPESLIEAAIPSKKNINETLLAKTDKFSLDSRSTTTVSNGITSTTSRDANDFLRGPANTRSIRFMNMFLDVLRIMCVGKVICLCLDDLQSAESESLELILNIIRAKIPVVFLFASRSEGKQAPEVTKKVLDMESGTTIIELSNLREKHVFEYVAATMSQEIEVVLPLAAVVYEKSAGNPFLVKEILQACYQRNCLWYDWRNSGWQFDLDKIFTELSSEGTLDNTFITSRLQELPPASRSILAWASLIGNAFSFKLVQEIMTGQFFYHTDQDKGDAACPTRAQLFDISESDAIDGLQQLMNLYIIMAGDSDDEFRFTHARYLRAANAMSECQNISKMHFIIAQTMMSYLSECRYSLYPLARHICLAANIIKERIPARLRYRDLLWRGAQKAIESGARSTALWYFKTSVTLLQDDRWNTKHPDVFYDETLQLLVNTAELMFLEHEDTEALALLKETFTNARCAADQTRSYILKGRIYSQQGHFNQAFTLLRDCLVGLGVSLPEPTWDQCDIDFKKLEYRLRTMDRAAITSAPLSDDKAVIALGTVLSDTVGAAYWYDTLLWYQLLIAFCTAALDRGMFIQAGVGFNQLGAAAVTRFKDIQLGLFFGEIALEFYQNYDDSWTRGRGWTLYTLFIGHLQTPLRNLLPILENALDYSLASGDTFISILNLGVMAVSRLWTGQDLSEIEYFCTYGPEEFDDWEKDVRGGTLLIATRQVARALQGKTGFQDVNSVLDDENHSQSRWMMECSKLAANANRSQTIYRCITTMAYHVLGFHEYVVKQGREMGMQEIEDLSSNRVAVSFRFFYALSLLEISRQKPETERQEYIEEAKAQKKVIECWGSLHDVNYQAWVHILAAAIADVQRVYYETVSNLEIAIDHCQVHGFAVEEAIAVEMQAEFLLARGAKRAGKVMIQEAIAAWNRLNATGKARQLADKHEWLLKTATTSRTMDVAVQTHDVTSFAVAEEATAHSKREYTNAWVGPKQSAVSPSDDASGLGLDILDLTSILEFSRVISSELQINPLLSKMTSVILESVGGQADFCAIVIETENQGWCVAASADHETGVKTYPDGIPFSEVDDQAAQQITHYILRTKETVFVQNILEDERFSNVGDAYLAQNPGGRSIIAIPVIQADHLMGVIHLEGRPNAFTQRNMIVLNLLTNQVAISLGNAFLYRKVRKVSASNASMVESQKKALAAAREAEAKAKKAEAEAMHNVKLKEEAAKAKSIFLANVSHELRTPLNGVIGMSELLKGTTLSKDQESYADSIRVCADTLLTVINDILDFSKLEAGKMQMFRVALNLKETITEVVRALAYTNKEHGLQTIEDLAVDDSLVLGDPVRLHQIFMNLLSNAYKFTPTGSVTVRARKVSETRDKVKMTCSVSDTGIGITKEQLSRLFQPFSQADSSTARSYGGSGLGLSICKAMIENVLGGKIWIESTPNVGTTVSFTLTFQKAPKDINGPEHMKISAKDPDPMANWSQSTSPQNEEKKFGFCDLSQIPREEIRVCIAEDNLINRRIAISFVTKLGLKCEAYEDGKQAYEALQQKSKEGNPFHLVLMDVQMPVMDGYNATKSIRADPDPDVNSVVVIAMTASAIRGDREKCLEAGMNDYLAKPVRQNVLKAMLDEYLTDTKAAVERAAETNVTTGDKLNGTVTKVSDANGQKAVNDVEGSPRSRRPIKRVVRGTSSNDVPKTTTGNASPPSGKRETDELGKVSTEQITPKISHEAQELLSSKENKAVSISEQAVETNGVVEEAQQS